MKKQEFTREQEDWLCFVLDEWYLEWKNKITDQGVTHSLGIAKEKLKLLLCEYPEI
jgi:hypothetical protein